METEEAAPLVADESPGVVGLVKETWARFSLVTRLVVLAVVVAVGVGAYFLVVDLLPSDTSSTTFEQDLEQQLGTLAVYDSARNPVRVVRPGQVLVLKSSGPYRESLEWKMPGDFGWTTTAAGAEANVYTWTVPTTLYATNMLAQMRPVTHPDIVIKSSFNVIPELRLVAVDEAEMNPSSGTVVVPADVAQTWALRPSILPVLTMADASVQLQIAPDDPDVTTGDFVTLSDDEAVVDMNAFTVTWTPPSATRQAKRWRLRLQTYRLNYTLGATGTSANIVYYFPVPVFVRTVVTSNSNGQLTGCVVLKGANAIAAERVYPGQPVRVLYTAPQSSTFNSLTVSYRTATSETAVPAWITTWGSAITWSTAQVRFVPWAASVPASLGNSTDTLFQVRVSETSYPDSEYAVSDWLPIDRYWAFDAGDPSTVPSPASPSSWTFYVPVQIVGLTAKHSLAANWVVKVHWVAVNPNADLIGTEPNVASMPDTLSTLTLNAASTTCQVVTRDASSARYWLYITYAQDMRTALAALDSSPVKAGAFRLSLQYLPDGSAVQWYRYIMAVQPLSLSDAGVSGDPFTEVRYFPDNNLLGESVPLPVPPSRWLQAGATYTFLYRGSYAGADTEAQAQGEVKWALRWPNPSVPGTYLERAVGTTFGTQRHLSVTLPADWNLTGVRLRVSMGTETATQTNDIFLDSTVFAVQPGTVAFLPRSDEAAQVLFAGQPNDVAVYGVNGTVGPLLLLPGWTLYAYDTEAVVGGALATLSGTWNADTGLTDADGDPILWTAVPLAEWSLNETGLHWTPSATYTDQTVRLLLCLTGGQSVLNVVSERAYPVWAAEAQANAVQGLWVSGAAGGGQTFFCGQRATFHVLDTATVNDTTAVVPAFRPVQDSTWRSGIDWSNPAPTAAAYRNARVCTLPWRPTSQLHFALQTVDGTSRVSTLPVTTSGYDYSLLQPALKVGAVLAVDAGGTNFGAGTLGVRLWCAVGPAPYHSPFWTSVADWTWTVEQGTTPSTEWTVTVATGSTPTLLAATGHPTFSQYAAWSLVLTRTPASATVKWPPATATWRLKGVRDVVSCTMDLPTVTA